MKEKRVIYGLVGFGGMGKWHAEILADLPGIELAGIYDIDEETRNKASFMGFRVYGSEQEIMEDPDIDVILIATPNDCHKPIAVRAMLAGKNVICEKPVTISSADLLVMQETAEMTGKFLTVHQNRRWDEDFLTVCKVMQERTLGDVFRIESRVHGSRGIPGDWRKEKKHGGGMVLDWGVHLLDQILFMTGNRKLTSVYASLTNITNQEVDDGFTALLKFEGNLEVLVEVGTNNFVSLPRWYVLGKNGSMIIEDWELHGKIVRAAGIEEHAVVPVRTAAGLTKTMAPRREDTIITEALPKVSGDITDFHKNAAAVLRGEAQPEVKLSQVMRVMRLMEAVFQSARLNQVIELINFE